MERNDPLLIYRNSKSRYTATGGIGAMAHSQYIRNEYFQMHSEYEPQGPVAEG